jgi:glc operon protein GlcG
LRASPGIQKAAAESLDRGRVSARGEWKLRSIVLPILSTLAAPALAQPAQTLDARAAQAIVAGCAAHSTAKGQSEAIAVVDAGGHLVASLRMDGNGSGIFDFALAKAQASAAWGFSTAQMLENARGTPGFDRAPNVVIVPGGVPVFSGDGKSRIGGVGVSGEAPPDDAACAEAGVRAAGLRTSRP